MDIESQKNKYKKVIKDEWIKVRVSHDEYQEILEKAKKAGRSVSDLIRVSIQKAKAPTLSNLENERRIIREVARIGNNLNQIARICNSLKSDVDAFELLVALKGIEAEVQSLTVTTPHFFSPAAPVFPSQVEMVDYVD
jgi:hypothetical protein